MPSRSSLWFVAGCLVGLSLVPVVAQTIRSNATQFPSVRIETNGSEGAPSLSFLNATTKGLFRLDANSVGISGHFVPGASATYDLGSSSNKFRNLYTSGTIAQSVGLFGAGSSGAPSISFVSTPTIGFYLLTSTIGVSGHLDAAVDNMYDIGGSPDHRFRDGIFAGRILANQYYVGAGDPGPTNLVLYPDGVFTIAGISMPFLGIYAGDFSSNAALDVQFVDLQGIKFDPSWGGVQPTCDAATRGFMWFVDGAVGTADQLQVCGRAADSSYAWVTLQ